MQFLNLSFEYYLSGRFAAINRLRIAPNLMHHAVELLIKYTLLRQKPARQQSEGARDLQDQYRHDLKPCGPRTSRASRLPTSAGSTR
jgi:hypothetical protein